MSHEIKEQMAEFAKADHPPNPADRHLTIIWEDEKEMLQKRLASCEERLKVLEGWAQRREPQLFMKAADPE